MLEFLDYLFDIIIWDANNKGEWMLSIKMYHVMYHTFILGLTVLETGKFDSNFLMPICLPTSDKFKDDDRGKFKCTDAQTALSWSSLC